MEMDHDYALNLSMATGEPMSTIDTKQDTSYITELAEKTQQVQSAAAQLDKIRAVNSAIDTMIEAMCSGKLKTTTHDELDAHVLRAVQRLSVLVKEL
jgi:hypothetical protein